MPESLVVVSAAGSTNPKAKQIGLVRNFLQRILVTDACDHANGITRSRPEESRVELS